MKMHLKEATFMMYINNVGFEWDETKAAYNLAKHGIDFHTAACLFTDPFAYTKEDESHSEAERREILIGLAEPGIVLVSFTRRFGGIYRIISARRANRKERGEYETKNRL